MPNWWQSVDMNEYALHCTHKHAKRIHTRPVTSNARAIESRTIYSRIKTVVEAEWCNKFGFFSVRDKSNLPCCGR